MSSSFHFSSFGFLVGMTKVSCYFTYFHKMTQLSEHEPILRNQPPLRRSQRIQEQREAKMREGLALSNLVQPTFLDVSDFKAESMMKDPIKCIREAERQDRCRKHGISLASSSSAGDPSA